LAATCPYGKDELIHPVHRHYWLQQNFPKFCPADFAYLKRHDPTMLA
jgi:hypothetical protein